MLFQDWLDVDAARRILSWAKKGLKVVVLEDAASRTPFNDGKDGALQKVMKELKGLPTVRSATVYDEFDYFSNAPGGYDDNVMEKLQELGVHPYTGYAKPNLQLLNQTRQDAAGNRYLYVYNYGDDEYNQFSNDASVRKVKFGTNIKTDIEVDGRFVPYVIDAWSGKVTELANYSWKDGKTVVPIDLDYNNIALMAFEKVDGEKFHVVSTNAESAHAVPDGLAVRATKSGAVTTKLSDGKQYKQDVTVPAVYDITDWDLTVESWSPGGTAGDLVRTETIGGLTTVNRKTSTVKTPIKVSLDKLTTWNNIPEVGKAVSGTGHYQATFTWDASKASGAYLDFGNKLEESMKVWINGHKVGGDVSTNPTKVKKDVGGVGKATIDDGTGKQIPLVGDDLYTGGVNWIKPMVDVSPYLVNGDNKIEIKYNSSLSNLQLSRGIGTITRHHLNWWKVSVDYLDFGPSQAKLVPFVEVQYVPVTGITLNPENPSVVERQSVQLRAVVAPANAKTPGVVWSSGDPAIATVDKTGLVTGLKPGVVMITAAARDGSGVAATVQLTVTKSGFKLNVASAKLQRGKSTTAIKASGLEPGDSVAGWTSSNPKVVTVNSRGKITAKKVGTATITATTAAGVSASVKITVVKGKLKTTSIKANVSRLTLDRRQSFQLVITRSPVTATEKITFKSSNSKVATVSKTGRIVGVKKGTATITVKTSNGKIAKIKVTVR